MDSAYLQLMLNHVPVFAVIFGFFLLLGGVMTRSKSVSRVGLGLLALAAIVAIPVYLTGEPAEQVVEKLPGVSEAITGQHESAAFLSLGLVMLSGLLALTALVFARSLSAKLPGYLVVATLVLSLLAGTSIIRTATLGGQIRHTEIRSGVANADPGTTEKDTSEKNDDED